MILTHTRSYFYLIFVILTHILHKHIGLYKNEKHKSRITLLSDLKYIKKKCISIGNGCVRQVFSKSLFRLSFVLHFIARWIQRQKENKWSECNNNNNNKTQITWNTERPEAKTQRTAYIGSSDTAFHFIPSDRRETRIISSEHRFNQKPQIHCV